MRVLIVDDSLVFRKALRDALGQQPGVEVVGWAGNGRSAVHRIAELRPDVVTLDLELPEFDGLEVLRELRRMSSDAQVIMLSGATTAGAEQTAQALRLGAFDFVVKPDEPTLEANVARLREALEPRLRLIGARHTQSHHASSVKVAPAGAACPLNRRVASAEPQMRRLVAIGVSTGGPQALATLLPQLPASLPAPVVVVQHMPATFTRSLATELDRTCPLHVCEATEGDVLEAGRVSIAPGGRQTRIVMDGDLAKIQITDDPPERGCRPSVDYLFRSAAETFGAATLGIILTGMGDDGSAGCRLLKDMGACVVAQNEASCVVYGMPRQVVAAGLADIVCPLDAIHEVILRETAPRGVTP